MKVKNIIIAILASLTFVSCIKEDLCPKNNPTLNVAPAAANAVLYISIEEENEARAAAYTDSETLVQDNTIENLIVYVFNNNKILIGAMSLTDQILDEVNTNGIFTVKLDMTPGYHFFYVVANAPASVLNDDYLFEEGIHFNDLVGTLSEASEEMLKSQEVPRTLLTEYTNTINIQLAH